MYGFFFYLTIIWFKVIFWKHKQDMLMIEKQYEGYTNKISFWALYSIGLNRRLSIHVVTKRNQSWYLLYIMNSWDTYIMWLVDVQGCFSFTLILFCFFFTSGYQYYLQWLKWHSIKSLVGVIKKKKFNLIIKVYNKVFLFMFEFTCVFSKEKFWCL